MNIFIERLEKADLLIALTFNAAHDKYLIFLVSRDSNTPRVHSIALHTLTKKNKTFFKKRSLIIH